MPFSIDQWVQHNGCQPAEKVDELLDNPDDPTRVIRKVWTGCDDDAEVVLFQIDGGGHTWPGGRTRLRLPGTVTGEINANMLMWNIFERHPMP